MNKPEENDLIAETTDKKTIMQSAKDFMNGVLSPLKGKDICRIRSSGVKRQRFPMLLDIPW